MKKINIILALSTLLFLSNVNAQNIIFKCIDSQGAVSYLNVNSAKTGTCSTTQLAEIDKNTNINNSKKTNNSSGKISKATFNTSETNQDNEQKIRDTKRKLVLSKELKEEEEQLESVNTMLKNIPANDTKQLEQLQEMKSVHTRNIGSLQKELGITSPVISNNIKTSSIKLANSSN